MLQVSDSTYLSWPFFEARHRAFADHLARWLADEALTIVHEDVDSSCRALVRALGTNGLLAPAVGGTSGVLDVRTLCIARDRLAQFDGLLDFAFAMQGLGSGPITLFGSDAQRGVYLPRVAAGEAIAAFALSEPNAGSDLGSMQTTATRLPNGDWRLDGEKTWISNAGIADFYVVFAKYPEGGERSYVALIVDATNRGLTVAERIETVAPHPLGRVVFEDCRVHSDALVGEAGRGLRVALGTLDIFRSTVGAAALGLGRRALDEALEFVSVRQIGGQRLADFQLTQARLAQMATEIDASALLVYRAAWTKDVGAPRVTREAAMAKWYATEAAQRTVDSAVQLLGGRGVVSGSTVERLYREVRSLRIYEGTSEVQQLVIANQLFSERATERS